MESKAKDLKLVWNIDWKDIEAPDYVDSLDKMACDTASKVQSQMEDALLLRIKMFLERHDLQLPDLKEYKDRIESYSFVGQPGRMNILFDGEVIFEIYPMESEMKDFKLIFKQNCRAVGRATITESKAKGQDDTNP